MIRNLSVTFCCKWVWVATFAVGLAAPVLAQPNADPAMQQPERPAQRTLEEVIVTARRIEESLQDTPVSVAAFSQDDLRKLGISEVGDIARFTPNLEMRKQPGSADDLGLAIRGLSNADPSLAQDPTVGVYMDGVYIARNQGLAFDIVDMQRIEVLRGPQGTLFGRNTIGGAINIVTEKPRGELAFRQEVGVGSRGRQSVKSTLDTPTFFGGVAAKLSLLYSTRDGLVTSLIDGRDIGQSEARAARLAVNFTPSEAFSADYALDWSRRETQPNIHQISHSRPAFSDPGGQFYGGQYQETLAASASPRRQSRLPIRSTDDDNSHSDIDGHALTLEWQALPNLTVKSISSYREWSSGSRDMDFGSFPAPADGSLCASPLPGQYDFVTGTCLDPVPAGELVPVFQTVRDNEQDQFTQELQFIGDLLNQRLRYTAGLYYFEEQGLEINPQRLVIAAPVAAAGFADAFGLPPAVLAEQNRGNSLVILLPDFRYSTDNEAYAVYGDFTYELLPRLEATLGFRYSVDRRETTLTNQLDGELKTVTESDTWSNFNPSLTLNYRWTDEINTYAKVVTGYRAGGFNIRAGTERAFSTPYNEEEVISYEVGWKAELLQRSLRFNGALFYVDYTDQQVNQFEAGSGGATSDVVNAGESTNYGLELEALWLPTENLRLSVTYAYLGVNYDEFIGGRVDPVTALATNPGVNENLADIISEDLWSPTHSGSLMAEYLFRPWQWGQLSARADVTYTDRMTFHPQLNRFDSADSQTLLNGRLTLSDIPAGRNGTLSAALWGRNLTDEDYREFGIDFSVVGFAMNTYGERRAIGLDLVYEFNR